MSRIGYTKYRPTASSRELIDLANEILLEFRADGYTATVRQVYYQFVGRDAIPNTLESYKRLAATISKARDGGLIDWDHIVDRTRKCMDVTRYEGPAELLDEAVHDFDIDVWDTQDTRIEVWVEKEALVEVVKRAALDEWDCPYFANRGYLSASAAWKAGRRIIANWQQGQSTTIIHVGDHDPSGIDMTRDIRERLALYSTPSDTDRIPEGVTVDEDGFISELPRFDVVRVALNRDQVDELDLPPNPAKMTDVRAPGYVAVHGHDSWELDALSPATLVEYIEDEIEKRCDVEKLAFRRTVREDWRDQLREFRDQFEG